MSRIFLTSDTHFGHQNICKFLRNDGVTKLRPWETAEEMDEALVKAWNKVVSPKDKVYHLGDVVIKRKDLKTLERLNGDKVLIRGNHDIFDDSEYMPYFRSIRGCHVIKRKDNKNAILTHIPIHPESLGRFGINIHGHTHSNNVMIGDSLDPRYFCVCVEQTNFTPILLDDVLNMAYSKTE